MSADPTYDRYREALRGHPLPAAFVDLDRFDDNADALLARAGERPIRVASKSVRCTPLLRRLFAHDDRFRGLLCFTAPEALWLAERGFDDLVVAYPTVEPTHLRAVADAVAAGHAITLMVDSPAHVDHLEAVLGEVAVPVPVAIDLDLSWDLPGLRFGVLRSPVVTAEDAADLTRRIVASPTVRLDGLMGYEAQVAGVAERAPGRSRVEQAVIVALKRASLRRVARARAAVVDAVEDVVGAPLRFVNGGGTGSLESTSRERAVTEVTAGSGLFAPGLFDHYDRFRHEPAAGFAVPVVRHPAPGVVTCLGGGYVASGPVGPDKTPVVWGPPGATLTPLEGVGEVQTPVRLPAGTTLRLGDPVLFRHAKAGELCERFATLLAIRGDEVVEELSTYRGDGASFL
ncbi:amino acid deaminase/aldolase [Nitriliruptoraceae bacterium ZYF776]|nr:amino acid deaminase/aldolase [Profundirhabdus halotolerans]